jgi:hypothetical protein
MQALQLQAQAPPLEQELQQLVQPEPQQSVPPESLLALPQQPLSEPGSLLKYLLWKASFRPSRLTSRAEWQRIDIVDTLCPP